MESSSRRWLKTQGILRYDPVRRDLRKQYKTRTLIIDLPHDDLDLYYQWFLTKKYGTWLKTQRPMFGKHVTVVRGDEAGFKSPNWKKHEGEKIDVYYAPGDLRREWEFWALPVKGDGLFELRQEVGLARFHDFHITVARQFDWQPKDYS